MKQIELELMCELSQEEVQFRAQELGGCVIRYEEVDAARADAAKEYREALQGIRKRMQHLSTVVREKRERRIVKCVVEFNVPAAGFKRTARLDTGEIHRDAEPMTPEERQNNLFEEEKHGD